MSRNKGNTKINVYSILDENVEGVSAYFEFHSALRVIRTRNSYYVSYNDGQLAKCILWCCKGSLFYKFWTKESDIGWF